MMLLALFNPESPLPPGCAAATKLPPKLDSGVLRVLVSTVGAACGRALSDCSYARNRQFESWLGWKDYAAPLRGVPRPLGRPPGRYPPPSPQNAKSPPAGGLLRCVAGVEGFEPPNGGIKTR